MRNLKNARALAILVSMIICIAFSIFRVPALAFPRYFDAQGSLMPPNKCGAPLYEPAKHSYEGKICWTTEIYDSAVSHAYTRQICVMDLATGVISRGDIDDSI